MSPDPLAALEAFGLPDSRLLDTFTGFSGAIVWRVQSGSAQFALKAYPIDWSDARRLTAIHRRILVAASDLMPQPVPTRFGKTLVESGGRLWDLVMWCDGSATHDIAHSTVEAIARLHVRWQWPVLTPQPSDTVTRQWVILNEWEEAAPTPAPTEKLADAVNVLSRQIEPTRIALRPWLNRPVPVQTIHGDLWSGNVLTHHGQFSGFIDCAAVRVDSVTSDLSRLFGTITFEAKRQIAECYEPPRPLQPVELELLQVLGRTGPVTRLAQWLKWLIVERRQFADPEAAERRFAAVVAQNRQLDTFMGCSSLTALNCETTDF